MEYVISNGRWVKNGKCSAEKKKNTDWLLTINGTRFSTGFADLGHQVCYHLISAALYKISNESIHITE